MFDVSGKARIASASPIAFGPLAVRSRQHNFFNGLLFDLRT